MKEARIALDFPHAVISLSSGRLSCKTTGKPARRGKQDLLLAPVMYTVCRCPHDGKSGAGGHEMKSANGKMGILKWAMLVGGTLLFGSVVSFVIRAFEMV